MKPVNRYGVVATALIARLTTNIKHSPQINNHYSTELVFLTCKYKINKKQKFFLVSGSNQFANHNNDKIVLIHFIGTVIPAAAAAGMISLISVCAK